MSSVVVQRTYTGAHVELLVDLLHDGEVGVYELVPDGMWATLVPRAQARLWWILRDAERFLQRSRGRRV